jgi:formylglycine-generating enzyme required for sulfatase activity
VRPEAPGAYYDKMMSLPRALFLEARPQVHIQDVFIKTFIKPKVIEIDVTLFNQDSKDHRILFRAGARAGGRTHCKLVKNNILLRAGEKRVIRLTKSFKRANLWWPNIPYRQGYKAFLYDLDCRIVKRKKTLDQKNYTFGFREVAQRNGHYLINNVPVRLRGENIWMWEHWDYAKDSDSSGHRDSTRWSRVLRKLQALNVNVVRFHAKPAASYYIDIADSIGMFSIVESGCYAIDEVTPIFKNHVKRMIRMHRNHPSIIKWSLENEMMYIRQTPYQDVLKLARAAREEDLTRPLTVDDHVNAVTSMDVMEDISLAYHYSGIQEVGRVFFYDTSLIVRRSNGTPLAAGEFVWQYPKPRAARIISLGMESRGLRFAGFGDIRPFCLIEAFNYFKKDFDTTKANLQVYKNSFHPIAVYDVEYERANRIGDSLGNWPVNPANLPADTVVERAWVAYNDLLKTKQIKLAWKLTMPDSGNKTWQKGDTLLRIPVAGKVVFPVSFRTPGVKKKTLLRLYITSSAKHALYIDSLMVYNVLPKKEYLSFLKQVTLSPEPGADTSMVTIPAGTFIRGSKKGKGDGDEIPQRKIYLDEFEIDATEVTWQQYNKCVKAGKCKPVPKEFNISKWNSPGQPVIGVTFWDAQDFCAYKGKRLPTETEWEKAARGTSGIKFPWGDDLFDKTKANLTEWYGSNSIPVASLPAGRSPFGCYDMSGNVWEWTLSWYHDEIGHAEAEKNPIGFHEGEQLTIRSGSWMFGNPMKVARAANKTRKSPEDRGFDVGFRCVKTAKPTKFQETLADGSNRIVNADKLKRVPRRVKSVEFDVGGVPK